MIFIALIFGHFGVSIPQSLGYFGLVLFIFTIGIQSGPGFFDSFKRMVRCASDGSDHRRECWCCRIGVGHLMGIDIPELTGLIAGALSSTPGLAVAIDNNSSPEVSIAYGIAYPFGVIGIILLSSFSLK